MHAVAGFFIGAIMQAIEGLIFDLDGTLVDSRQDIVQSVNHMLLAMGLPRLPAQQISGYVGEGIRNLIRSCLVCFGREDLLEEGIAQMRQVYGTHLLDNTRPYPGVVAVLRHFQTKRLAVVSNKPEDFTRRILDGLDMRSYFSVVLGGDSLAEQKPYPGPLLHVLDRWQCKPAQVVVVGDSVHDIDVGKKVGTWTCGVTYGFKTRAELQAHGPDWLIDDVRALQECVC